VESHGGSPDKTRFNIASFGGPPVTTRLRGHKTLDAWHRHMFQGPQLRYMFFFNAMMNYNHLAVKKAEQKDAKQDSN
jgi:hypothetical protein